MKTKVQGMLMLLLGCVLPGYGGADTMEFEPAARFVLPADTEIEGFPVGGLSGIAFDPGSGLFLCVSDARRWDRSKVFGFRLEPREDGGFSMQPVSVLALEPGFSPPEPLDAEGIAVWNRNRMFISHEGSRSGRIPPGISCFHKSQGTHMFDLPVPEYFLPNPKNQTGMQDNRGFEGVSLSRPRPTFLFAAVESPLLQDLSRGQSKAPGPIRILRYRLSNRESQPEERAYMPENDAIFTSVPEILHDQDGALFVLERQMLRVIPPRKRRVRIFRVDFDQADATDIAGVASLRNQAVTPLTKTLLFDSELAGLRDIDNLEGMGFGPDVGGRDSLLLVSDNNFRKDQRTEFLLLRKRAP